MNTFEIKTALPIDQVKQIILDKFGIANFSTMHQVYENTEGKIILETILEHYEVNKILNGELTLRHTD